MNNFKNGYYIMGCATLGKYLQNFLFEKGYSNFLGFLDNKISGENVFNPKEVEDKAFPIVLGSINYIHEMTQQLRSLGYKNIINFVDLITEYPELQNFNQAFIGLKEDYINNSKKYEWLKTILADEESKNVLETLIEFRKTLNIELYSKISRNPKLQYFDILKDIDIFVDGGAFDGDTVENMINLDINPTKIYFFEPDKNSLNKAKLKLEKHPEIEYYPYGLSNENKVLKFKNDGTLGACFSEEGDVKVQCVSLDDTVKEDKAFIKLDIEGFEISAIHGAKRLLNNGSPFAICVYHKPTDIWEIPETILNLTIGENNSKDFSWKFYLRHYSNTIFETVLYGVPYFS